jgi:hypothetical protein
MNYKLAKPFSDWKLMILDHSKSTAEDSSKILNISFKVFNSYISNSMEKENKQ